MTPAEVFDALAGVVESVLAPRAFRRSHDEKHPHAFGSRSRTWKSGEDLIRLTWDGKEQIFVVEASDEPDASGRPVWIDVDLRQWAAGFRYDLVASELRARLVDYLG